MYYRGVRQEHNYYINIMISTFKVDKSLKMEIKEIKEKKVKDIFTRQNLYTTNQVSTMSGFSVNTIRKDMEGGRLKFIIRGERKYITAESLKMYLHNGD